MRPGLTIALLLIASFGAQGAGADLRGGDGVAPRLLAALMEQPSGALATSQLLLPPAGRLLGQFISAPFPAEPVDGLAAYRPPWIAAAPPMALSQARHPVCPPRVTRGP